MRLALSEEVEGKIVPSVECYTKSSARQIWTAYFNYESTFPTTYAPPLRFDISAFPSATTLMFCIAARASRRARQRTC